MGEGILCTQEATIELGISLSFDGSMHCVGRMGT
jgi:hypothetical protein